MSKPDGGPAFPNTHVFPSYDGDSILPGWKATGGMTLRDYFAAKAMQVIMPTFIVNHPQTPEIVAKLSYGYADAMIKEREKP